MIIYIAFGGIIRPYGSRLVKGVVPVKSPVCVVKSETSLRDDILPSSSSTILYAAPGAYPGNSFT